MGVVIVFHTRLESTTQPVTIVSVEARYCFRSPVRAGLFDQRVQAPSYFFSPESGEGQQHQSRDQPMATLKLTTSSTWSNVDPDAKDQIEAIADEYNFQGANGEVVINVNEDSDGDTVISIHGYATFDPSKPIRNEDGEYVDEEHGYAEEFLGRIAPHLEEQLVIETVGHEKCRFPLLASQWSVWPDGTVQYESFNHDPEKLEAGDEDAQFGVLNTDRDLFVKLGSGGPALTSDRDKAVEEASGKYNNHLEPVRVETTPITDDRESR
jgi:hypothetical protein